MSGPLHLVSMALKDPAAVHRFARTLHLPDHPFDPGYVLHCLLAELFGGNLVKPFGRDPRRGDGFILGYSPLGLHELHERAQTSALPHVYEVIDWRACAGKPMPQRWKEGVSLGFRARVCPMVRGPSAHGRTAGKLSEQPEVDAYLARVWRDEAAPPRESVYVEWLTQELGRKNAACLESAKMAGFSLSRCLRRGRGRKSRIITCPDAVFQGSLLIQDAESFGELIARGLGRQRAFGFGMLMLHAARAG